jgi:hypothetical protein
VAKHWKSKELRVGHSLWLPFLRGMVARVTVVSDSVPLELSANRMPLRIARGWVTQGELHGMPLYKSRRVAQRVSRGRA